MNDLEEYIFDKKLLGYDFLERIKITGTGEIYKCLWKSKGEVIAIKIITVFDSDIISDIINELTANYIGADHPYGRLYDAFSYKGNLFLVQEYFENGSIGDLIDAKKKLSYKECGALIEELINFVCALEKHNCFGLAIHPSRLLIDRKGKVRAFRFEFEGLYKESLAKCKSKFTSGPYYLAPEIITGKSPVSIKADIWAIGIITYELATGELAYKKLSKTKVLFEIVNKPPPSLGSEYPEDIQSFIGLALQKDPSFRVDLLGLLGSNFIRNASSVALLTNYLFMNKEINYEDQLESQKESRNQSREAEGLNFAFSQREYEKGSIISRDLLLEVNSKLPIAEESQTKLGEDAQEISAVAVLKLKRAIRKVEKMHPGLTQKVAKAIYTRYLQTSPNATK